VSLDSQVSGFSHPYYPIYLNQNKDQRALTFSYRVFACLNGQPEQAIDVNQHELRILPILRYGQTAGAVPEPQLLESGDSEPSGSRAISDVAVNQLPADNHLNTMSFHISSDCLSIGGFETTVRLRLLVLSPVDNVVLAFVDSSRFVVMTRELPAEHRMVTYLRDWGFPMHPDDVESQRFWAQQSCKRSSKKRRLEAPCEFPSDRNQDSNPLAISMPDGSFLYTQRGLQAMSSRITPAQPASAVSPAAQATPVVATALPVKLESRSRLKRELQCEEPRSAKKAKTSMSLIQIDDLHFNQSDSEDCGSVSSGEFVPFKLEIDLPIPQIEAEQPAPAAADSTDSVMKFLAASPVSIMTPIASTLCLDPDFDALSAQCCATVIAGIAQGLNLPFTVDQIDSMPHTDDTTELAAAFQLPAQFSMGFMPATPWLSA
jgi:hypothetical protein